MRWTARLIKAIGIAALLGWMIAGSALLAAMFGKCATADFVAKLAPSWSSWTHDQIAEAVMKVCLRGCEPKVALEIIRYCHDESPNFRYYEEGIVMFTRVDSRGLTIGSIKLQFIPGKISGLPAISPTLDPELPAIVYSEALDPRYKNVVRSEPYISGDQSAVDYTLLANERISGKELFTIPIRFYALVTRSNPTNPKATPITCTGTSELTTMDCSITTGSGTEYRGSAEVKTQLVSWKRLRETTGARQYFENQRTTA